jgi:hypothetical protein
MIDQDTLDKLRRAFASLPDGRSADVLARDALDAARDGVLALTLDADGRAAEETVVGVEAAAAIVVRRWGGVVLTRYQGVSLVWEHTQETGFLSACAGLAYPWSLGLTPERAQRAALISEQQAEALNARARADYASWRRSLAANAAPLREVYGGAAHPPRKLSEQAGGGE